MKTVNDFGADPTGARDSSAAFQAAADSGETSISIPTGTYRVNGFTVKKPMSWIGEGRSSVIVSDNPTATVMTIETSEACYITGVVFDTRVPRTAGAYIRITGANNWPNGKTEIDSVTFVSPFRGIDFASAALWSVSQCYFVTYVDCAISVANAIEPDAGDSNIEACIFDAGGDHGIAVSQWSSGGLRIINNKFINGAYHYLGQFNTESRPTSILLVANNSFEWARASSVALNSAGATFNFLLVNNNQFSLLDGATGVLVQNPASGLNFLSGGVIGSNLFNTTGKRSTAITLNSGREILVGTNNTLGVGTAAVFGNNLQRITCSPQAVSASVTKFAGNTRNVIFI